MKEVMIANSILYIVAGLLAYFVTPWALLIIFAQQGYSSEKKNNA